MSTTKVLTILSIVFLSFFGLVYSEKKKDKKAQSREEIEASVNGKVNASTMTTQAPFNPPETVYSEGTPASHQATKEILGKLQKLPNWRQTQKDPIIKKQHLAGPTRQTLENSQEQTYWSELWVVSKPPHQLKFVIVFTASPPTLSTTSTPTHKKTSLEKPTKYNP